jgi:hypothetical protein
MSSLTPRATSSASSPRPPEREADLRARHSATRSWRRALAAGLTHHLISRADCTELAIVVIPSAFVPTLIAQLLFRPAVLDREEEEALGEEDLSIIHSGQTPAPGPGD